LSRQGFNVTHKIISTKTPFGSMKARQSAIGLNTSACSLFWRVFDPGQPGLFEKHALFDLNTGGWAIEMRGVPMAVMGRQGARLSRCPIVGYCVPSFP